MAGKQGTALVTGASSGIGAVYARKLAERGYDVVLVARRLERLQQLGSELTQAHRVRAEVLVADLTLYDDVQRVAERASGGDLSLVVNNAGVGGYAPFHEVEPRVAEQLIRLHVLAPTLVTRAALPGMLARERGAIVNVASLLAFSGSLPPRPLPFRATYAGCKAFLVTFTRTLQGELDGTKVRAQVVCPGMTETEFNGGYPGTMSPEDVVSASLVALDRGETVCIPGLVEADALKALEHAEGLLRQGSVRELAPRYRTAGS